MKASERDLVVAVVRFCRALRDRGLRTSPGEAVLAARALGEVDVSDRREVYLALRAVLVMRVEDYDEFDEAFTAVWSAAPHAAGVLPGPEPGAGPNPPRNMPGGRNRRYAAAQLERWTRTEPPDAEPVVVPAVSDREVLAEKDFSTFEERDHEEFRRAASRLIRRLALRPGRRWEPSRRGPRIDRVRTFRRSFRTDTDIVELVFRKRRPRKTKLVVICDVSGSMDVYSRILLQFLYALQNRFDRMESFVFSTRLSRVTEQLRGGSYAGALSRLSRSVRDWSGGTRIGRSLGEFQRRWPRLVDRRTVVIVLSDGWDTGEPEELASALRSLRRRAGRLIWLNPLLGSPAYRPLTRGMQAALPHIDIFAPAHNLASLEALARHLKS